MSLHSSLLFIAAGLTLAGAVASAPLPALKSGDVLIENTGSTNTTGYQIVVSAHGSASYREVTARGDAPNTTPKPREQAMPKALITKLFKDLAAAGNLSALPARHGMRSASFGTATFMTYKGQRSPDLTFPASLKAQALRDDIQAVIQTMHVATHARRPLSRPLVP